tara:strand:- start:112 stop:711 length:600 start_codon:yes stop_codon:yes gene_type:complete
MSNIVKNIGLRQKANDVIYTPKPVAKLMIDLCDIQLDDKVLDCSKGGGVFYDNFPECIKDYCEITEDKDFFKYDKPVDIIVGNPPYSLWSKWLQHTIKLNPMKFCYIFGVYNFTTFRLQNIYDAGYIVKKLHFLKVDWWFSPSFIVVFEKGEENKDSLFSFSGKRIMCENCGKRCMRGRTSSKNGIKTKHDPNKCSELK